MKPQVIDPTLSITDSYILKGIAIITMLCHHVFIYLPHGIEIQFSDIFIYLGIVGKVCVCIFLFLSGYALTIQFKKIDFKGHNKKWAIQNSILFVIKRLLKFYISYWFIFILFVPLGVYVFNRPLTIPYGEESNIATSFIIDIFGFASLKSYNITWWFNKMIISLYILFPILYFVSIYISNLNYFASKYISNIILLLSSLIVAFKFGFDFDLNFWQLPFVLGMLYALNIYKLDKALKNINYNVILISVISVFGFLVIYRVLPQEGLKIDPFLTIAIIGLYVVFKQHLNKLTPLSYLGKHSMNIYMIHTFIYSYWFPNYIYTFEYAPIVLIVLIGTCLILSIVIEFLKRKLGMYNLQNKLIHFFGFGNVVKNC